MLSKAQIKYIHTLHQKKLRHSAGVYVVEGEKIIHEYLAGDYPLANIYATGQWLAANSALLKKKKLPVVEEVTQRELQQISSLTTPNQVVALARIPKAASVALPQTGLHLALENLQDPGNLGTIIRTADWFGVKTIFCSEDCVDAYNSKVVQATMGSLARVSIHYTDLAALMQHAALPVYAAVLQGENLFRQTLPEDALILIGNESKGVSAALAALAKKKISIPRWGKAESLNASVAAAVIVAQFRKG